MTTRDRLRGAVLSSMRRYPNQGWIAGVSAGLAAYFDWNTKVIRLIFLLALIFGGFFPAGVVYLVLWYLLDADYSPALPADASPAPGPAPSRPAGSANMSDSQLKARFSRLEERLAGMEECVVSKDFELRRELRKLET
ncbi:MAG: PspC domain-containing protein [Stenotrophobium sp.]